jgi:outer membrane protein assembly factor BamB
MEDGTVYLGTTSGTFTGICPNGIPRFSLVFPPTQSSVALTQDPNSTSPDPIIVAGGTNGQVRAFNVRGRQFWSFSASATIVAAVLIDDSTDLFYVADTSGRVFAGALTNGLPVADFSFAPAQSERPATITASPALGKNNAARPKLYVAGQSVVGQSAAEQRGVLYALDRASGAVCWTFEAEGPISSSPAVATGGSQDVIVFAADRLAVLDPATGPVTVGGRVYAIPDREDDLCDGAPRCAAGDVACPVWTFDTGSIDPPGYSYSFGAASPSIGSDGTVYIGRSGSRIGRGRTDCPDPTVDPCVVNDGGALYAIHQNNETASRGRDREPRG